MTIGVVIDKLYPGKIGGAEQYVRNILKQWNKQRTATILFTNAAAATTFRESIWQKIVIVPDEMRNPDALWKYYAARYAVNVFFCPLFYLPSTKTGIPMVVAVHDIQYEYYPQFFTPELLAYRRTETKKALKHADWIITMSAYSRQTICEKYGTDAEKITVIYEDADCVFNKSMDMEHFHEKRYLLYPANGWPHKNHERLIDAMKILREKYDSDLRLVLTGNFAQWENDIRAYIGQKKLNNTIDILGYVEQKKIPGLFRNAEMLVYPSLFEGFGIPLVEAMKAGIPIACSKETSIPEVCQDAAIYFDAFSPEDIAQKIMELDTNEDLRRNLIEKGNLRGGDFSWEKCAEQTRCILKKATLIYGERFVCPAPPTVYIATFPFRKYYPAGKCGRRICSNYIRKWEIFSLPQKYPNVKIRSIDTLTVRNAKKAVNETAGMKKKRAVKIEDRDIVLLIDERHSFKSEESIDRLMVDFVQSADKEIFFYRPKTDGVWGNIFGHALCTDEMKAQIRMEAITFCAVMFHGAMKEKDLQTVSRHSYLPGFCQQELYEAYKDKALIRDGTYEIAAKSSWTDDSAMCGYAIRGISLRRKLGYIPESLIETCSRSESAGLLKALNRTAECGRKELLSYLRERTLPFNGVSGDGWMSKELEMEIPLRKGTNDIVVCLRGPVFCSGKLLLYLNDKTVGILHVDLAKGEAETNGMGLSGTVRISMRYKSSKDESVKLNLLSDHLTSFYEQNGDLRGISFPIDSVLVNGNEVL